LLQDHDVTDQLGTTRLVVANKGHSSLEGRLNPISSADHFSRPFAASFEILFVPRAPAARHTDQSLGLTTFRVYGIIYPNEARWT
jgi:hypothetical protein